MPPYEQSERTQAGNVMADKSAMMAKEAAAHPSEISRVANQIREEAERLSEVCGVLEKRLTRVLTPVSEGADKVAEGNTLTEQAYNTPHASEQYETVISLRRTRRRVEAVLGRLEV